MTTLLDSSHDMYDSISRSSIPANPYAVAFYTDGLYTWDPSIFTRALKLGISAIGTNSGQVGDCESGDMTPASVCSWAVTRQRAGVNCGIYCSASAWQSVQNAVNATIWPLGFKPWYWIAHYDNIRELPVLNNVTALAKQFASNNAYDTSCMSDTLVSILGGVVTNPDTGNALAAYGRVDSLHNNLDSVRFGASGIVGEPNQLKVALNGILNGVNSIATNLGADTTAIEAAITALQTHEDASINSEQQAVIAAIAANPGQVTLTDAQVTTLSSILGPDVVHALAAQMNK